MDESLRKTPLYRALHRPQLLLGGDRKIMVITLAASALLILVSRNTVSIVFGLIILAIGVYGLRRAAKADPMMREVYLRHIQYKGYYAPFSRPWRVANSKRVY